MSTAYRRLRRQMPWLTPEYAGEDAPRDLLNRFKDVRVPMPVDGDEEMLPTAPPPIITDAGGIPALRRPPLSVVSPQNPDDPKFREWYQQRAQRLGLNPNPDDPLHQYDYRKAFAAGVEPDASGHWPSQFKLPNHPNRYVDGIDTISGAPALSRIAPPVEFGQPYGTVPTLARPPLHDIDRIAALGEENPLPTTESDIPLLSRPIEMPRLRPQPTVIHDAGRPTPIVFGTDDPEQRILARRRALEAYQPQKESKKSLALRTILNFVGGGIPGAVGTLIGPAGVLDRRGKDRAWQQGELGQIDEQLGRMRTDRRAGLQDRLLEEQVRKAGAPPPIKDITSNGRVLRLNPQTGRYDTVYEPPPKPASERAPLRVPVTLPDGSTKVVLSFDNGKTWQDEPKLQGAPKPNTAPTQRAAILDNIAAAEREKASLGPPPQTMIDEVNQWGEVTGKKVNPAYAHWADRFQKLDDNIRNWKVDLGKLPESTAPPVLTRGNVTAPPTFLAAFKKKHGRAPTQSEIEAYAQAANAR